MSEQEMIAVFNEWFRQWQEDKESFSEIEAYEARNSDDYGIAATRTFLRIKRGLYA